MSPLSSISISTQSTPQESRSPEDVNSEDPGNPEKAENPENLSAVPESYVAELKELEKWSDPAKLVENLEGKLPSSLVLSDPTDTENSDTETGSRQESYDSQEVQEQIPVRFGKKIERYSSSGIEVYPVMIGDQRVATMTLMSDQAKAMMITQQRSTAWFDQKGTPKIDAIQKYFDDTERDLDFMMPGPMFHDDGIVVGLGFDNGQAYGDVDLEELQSISSRDELKWRDQEAVGKAICIVSGGQVSLSHTTEMSPMDVAKKVKEGADVFTLWSAFRMGGKNDALIPEGASSYIFENALGDTGVLQFDDTTTAAQKEAVFARKAWARIDTDGNTNYFKRIAYTDSQGSRGQLNQYWYKDQGKLRLGNIEKERRQWSNQTDPHRIQGRMPNQFLIYHPEK